MTTETLFEDGTHRRGRRAPVVSKAYHQPNQCIQWRSIWLQRNGRVLNTNQTKQQSKCESFNLSQCTSHGAGSQQFCPFGFVMLFCGEGKGKRKKRKEALWEKWGKEKRKNSKPSAQRRDPACCKSRAAAATTSFCGKSGPSSFNTVGARRKALFPARPMKFTISLK